MSVSCSVATRTPRSNGQRLMRVRVIESDEELDYPYAEVLDDPEEL
jgi:hypothetical protein